MLKRPLTVFALGVALAAAWWGYRQHQDDLALKAKLAMTVAPRSSDFVDCASFTDQKPLVLLALGQSNAGNHGSLSASADAPVLMMIGTHCLVANDPLPGATGSGGSIWRHLPTMLGNELAGRKVVLSVLAVDATSIDDWIRPGSAIGRAEHCGAAHAGTQQQPEVAALFEARVETCAQHPARCGQPRAGVAQ